MAKKDQAQQLYNDNVSTRTRPEIIKIFIEELNMSQAGASTYYANCRSAANGNQPTINMNKVIKRVKAILNDVGAKDQQPDNRTVYTVCTLIKNVVQDDEIGSFFDEQLARDRVLPHQTVVLGDVNVGDFVNC
jgi:hypothetical protein